jgi:hypothetical protein
VFRYAAAGQACGFTQSGISMSRNGAETGFLLISEAVARLKVGMYAGLNQPEPIANIKKSEPRLSIELGAQKEDAAERIYEAIVQGELSVFVLPASTDKVHRTLLQVPLGILKRMMRTRGSLPDHAIQPLRIFAKDPITDELRAALSQSALYLQRREFDAWHEEAKKKLNWPSQRSSCKPRMGRPSRQSDLHNPIIVLVNEGRWSAEQNFIADLVKLLKSKGVTASRQTVERTVKQLHRETGDHRYYYADPRKKPDDSVWGSFEDLMKRRRRQNIKNDQKS